MAEGSQNTIETRGVDDAEIVAYIEKEPPSAEGVFEVGLVLAGAISAGAYSAGVMDFLIEALDAWEAARASGQDVPQHQVHIRVIAGASAGAMTAAISSVAMLYEFPHVRPGLANSNPLYESWVKSIDISKLLGIDDLAHDDAVLSSLLNSNELDKITNAALDYQPPQRKQRPFLNCRVRFIFSQGGLRGIPYYLPIPGNAGAGLAMSMHKSYRSFSVAYNGNRTRRPDDLLLQDGPFQKSADSRWQQLGNAALGSGAFPLGLRPRLEARKVEDLSYRYVPIPGVGPVWLKPAWSNPIGGQPSLPPTPVFDEFVVDGGTMDNEPLDMARTELAGTNNFNERDGERASRAIIMIDPFPDKPVTDHNLQATGRSGNMFSATFGLLGAWKNQARFNPIDLALALDESVFSRFLISPSRKAYPNDPRTVSNGYDLASGTLGGFGGFLAESYRHHDYMLGRRNCQQFLQKHFSLKADNPLFPQTSDFRNKWEISASGELPIIPLMPGIAGEEPLPDWPEDAVDLDVLQKQIDRRLKQVVSSALSMAGVGGFKRWAAGLGVQLVKTDVLAAIIAKIQKELEEHNLKVTPNTKRVVQKLPTENQYFDGS